MGKEAAARELRRETKRTLGNKLQEFAANERARLDNVEKAVVGNREHCDKRWIEVAKTMKKLGDRLFELEQVNARGFFGRLGWLVLGR